MQTDTQMLIDKTELAAPLGMVLNSSRRIFDMSALLTDFSDWCSRQLANRKRLLTVKISSDIPQYFQGNQALVKHLLFVPGKNILRSPGIGEVILEVTAEQCVGRIYAMCYTITTVGDNIPLTREKELFLSAAACSEKDGFQQRSTNLYYARMIARDFGGDICVNNDFESGLSYQVKFNLLTPQPDSCTHHKA